MDAIYRAIEAMTTAYPLAPPWAGLQAHPAYRLLPDDRNAMLIQLQGQFTDADLLLSGVAMKQGAAAIDLHASLVRTRRPIVMIRSKSNQELVGLMADNCAICSAALSSVILHQLVGQFANQMSKPQYIVLSFDIIEAAILAACGIAAIPAPNLKNVRPIQLRRILDLTYFSCEGCGDSAKAHKRQMAPFKTSWEDLERRDKVTSRLVVPVCRFADFGAPSQDSVDSIEILQTVARHFVFENNPFDVWQPSQVSRERLAWQLKYDLSTNWASSLQRSLASDCVPATQFQLSTVGPVQRLARAINDLHNLDQSRASSEERQTAWSAFLAAIEDARIAPLLKAAEGTKDLLQREQLMQLADLARVALPLLHGASRELRKSLRQQVVDSCGEVSIPREQLDVVNKYMAFLMEVFKCKQARRQRAPKSNSLLGGRDWASRLRRRAR